MDKDRHRISLGMKDVYIMENNDLQTSSEQDPDEDIIENGITDGSLSAMFPGSSSFCTQNMDVEYENAEPQFLAQAESRASVPPLEVTLDDIEQFNGDNIVSQDQEHPDVDTVNEKKKQLTKKKAKEERLVLYSFVFGSCFFV